MLTWPWSASLPEEAAAGKTSVVFQKKKKRCKHRLDNTFSSPKFSWNVTKSLPEDVSMSHGDEDNCSGSVIKHKMTSFLRLLFIYCAHADIKSWQSEINNRPLSHYLKKDRNHKPNKPGKREEYKLDKSLSREGFRENFKR